MSLKGDVPGPARRDNLFVSERSGRDRGDFPTRADLFEYDLDTPGLTTEQRKRAPEEGDDHLIGRETLHGVCSELHLRVVEIMQRVAARNGATLSELLDDRECWRRVVNDPFPDRSRA